MRETVLLRSTWRSAKSVSRARSNARPAAYQSLGVTVARVMTDNGGCYKAFDFRDACRDLGLKHIRTRPYTPKIGQGCFQEDGSALLLLVGHDLGEGDAGRVVDADMDEFQPRPWPRLRRLLWPWRSPVMRWPIPSMQPSFLISM